MLFPSLITESMLPKKTYRLQNGEELAIRIATLSDLNAIIDIQIACYDGEAPWGRIAVNNELRNRRNAFFLMVYHNERAIAFVGLSKRIEGIHVTNIATLPEYQGNGIATSLIYIAIDLAKQLEKNKITLEVRMSNERAKNLYRHLGFNDGMIKKNYYHNNGEDALDMIYLINERTD